MRKMLLVAAALLVSVAPSAVAQSGEGSFEGKLLRMLEERGVITADEAVELGELATDMRASEELDSQISSRIDEMVATMAPVTGSVTHKLGKGYQLMDGDFSLTLGGRAQVRFTYTDDGDEEVPNFSLPRVRLWLNGEAFENFSYKVQFDVAGDEADSNVPNGMGGSTLASSRNRLTELKDAYANYKHNDQLQVRFGQFKAPYSRQWLTSSSALQLVDRSLINSRFGIGRQVGIMVHGKAGEDGMFQYMAGVFDGEGENRSNDDEGLMWAGRVSFDPLGAAPKVEGDHRVGNDRPMLLSFGANAWYHQDDNMVDGEDDWSIGADGAIYVQGFSGLLEIHFRENGATSGADEEIFGILAQAGYFIVPAEFEVVARMTWQDFDGSSLEEISEYTVGFGYFPGLHGHNLKVQLDFTYVEECFVGGSSEDYWRIRIQFQIIF